MIKITRYYISNTNISKEYSIQICILNKHK
jgi:hypothetical protein